MKPAWVRHAEKALGETALVHRSLGGGGIAHAGRLETADRVVFVKRSAVAEALECEQDGLSALRAVVPAHSGLRVPRVLAFSRVGPGAILILEWIEQQAWTSAAWMQLAQGLAAMHCAAPGTNQYGWGRDNRIGSTVQPNEVDQSWTAFFASERLEYQTRLARDSGNWSDVWNAPASRLISRLSDFLPANPRPSLVHGDLWSGNVLSSGGGAAWLIDPAVYIGHSEVDLAMSRLFGGFGAEFYSAYAELEPLEGGWEDRSEIYNLYHLLNHLNIFGRSYASSVERVLFRYGR